MNNDKIEKLKKQISKIKKEIVKLRSENSNQLIKDFKFQIHSGNYIKLSELFDKNN